MALTSLFVVGCSGSSVKVEKTPAVEVSIEGMNEGDLAGFTYLYDYGNGFRLYADNFTKIVYVMYYDNVDSGTKAVARSSSLSPYISPNGNYCYIDTEARQIKELITDNSVVNSGTSVDNNQEGTDNQTPSSTTIDESISNKIDQNRN